MNLQWAEFLMWAEDAGFRYMCRPRIDNGSKYFSLLLLSHDESCAIRAVCDSENQQNISAYSYRPHRMQPFSPIIITHTDDQRQLFTEDAAGSSVLFQFEPCGKIAKTTDGLRIYVETNNYRPSSLNIRGYRVYSGLYYI